jgi:cytochrome c
MLSLIGCKADDRAARLRAAGPEPTREALARVASASAGAGLFRRCAACHSITKGAGDRDGPNLFGVVGRPIAQGSSRFGYTDALRRAGGDWTDARLDAWLANPQRFAPGTSMSFPGLPDPLDRADVVAYLKTQR